MMYVWVFVFCAALAIEAFMCGITAVWFAPGALCALAAARFGIRWELQIFLFMGVSCGLMRVIRPYIVTFLNRKKARRFAELREKYGDPPMYGEDPMKGWGQMRKES